MKHVKLQAHKGVASECPENTLSAFLCAAVQKYDVIELDLNYTLDKKIVVIHDNTINRTARQTNGREITNEVCINNITYEQALEYDFGLAMSNKFKGEKIPLFKDVLVLAAANKIRLKIDNKLQSFPDNMLDIFFSEIKAYTEYVSITSNSIEFIKKCKSVLPDISFDYDGEVTEAALKALRTILPKDKLTVWLPYKCKNTAWVKLPFADSSAADLVHRYAGLGIWLISEYDDFYDVLNRFNPDIVETDGKIKSEANCGKIFDMHTHSQNSHDSECPVSEMAKAADINNLSGFAVTDHCDIGFCNSIDISTTVQSSVADAEITNNNSTLTVLKGVEIGEAFWFPKAAATILSENDFDVVIGSVHAVKFKDYDMPYSQINFAELGINASNQYFDKYLDDMITMINTCDFDILAHLTCPLRYINGKYGMGLSCKDYIAKIQNILTLIIKCGIALEVNTSCIYNGSGYCEFMPEQWIIELYKELGGHLITLGSDAHISENSANMFGKAYSALKQIGFESIYYYKNRYPVQCKIISER